MTTNEPIQIAVRFPIHREDEMPDDCYYSNNAAGIIRCAEVSEAELAEIRRLYDAGTDLNEIPFLPDLRRRAFYEGREIDEGCEIGQGREYGIHEEDGFLDRRDFRVMFRPPDAGPEVYYRH